MRSKDYSDQVASFTPLSPTQMVRVALVEGMKLSYPNNERQRYRRLVKSYLGINERRIDKLFNLMEVEKPTQSQKNFLNDLIAQAAYDSGYWKQFDYKRLKREGVVIDHDGELDGLVKLLLKIDESKVIFVPKVGDTALAPRDEPDYLKHIHWTNKLILNGPDVVTRFAKDHNIELPKNYLKSRRMTTEVLKLLEENGFYFNEALKSGIAVLKEPKYEDRVITTMAIKRRDGTEIRLHPHDFAEAAEFYIYCLLHNKEIIETLGTKISEYGDKYHGANTFLLPKRRPEDENEYNKVEIHYFPDPRGEGPYPLDWMNTRVTCDCPHALNMRNFEDRRGKMTRVVETMDTHVNMVYLALMDKKGITVEEAVNNMSPIPTLEFSNLVDRTRYNLVQECEIQEGDKTKIRRTYVGEVGIEKLIHELAKLPGWTFKRMFNPSEKVGNLLLKPMYV